VFALASEREPWGLIVNEVMNASKPVIISDQVGAGPDLVQDGENGFIVPVGDIAAIRDRLHQLTGDPETARRMGERSRQIIDQWSFRQDLDGITQALADTVGTTGKS